MGEDNFNKKSDDTGGKSLSDADRFLAAINTGKKHRQSTPERLEKIAMKKLNQIVDTFIEKMQILTKMEKAAVKGESSIEIGWLSFYPLLDADAELVKLGLDSKNAHQFSNLILCVVDSGGSGIIVTKDVYQFFRALIQRFMPEMFAPKRPIRIEAPAMLQTKAPSGPPSGLLPPMPEMPPMPEIPPISSGIEVNLICYKPASSGWGGGERPLQLKEFENQSIPGDSQSLVNTLKPKLIRLSW